MATHSSIPAWRTPWTEEPGGLYSLWGRKESNTTNRLSTTIRCVFHDKTEFPKLVLTENRLSIDRVVDYMYIY